MTGNRKQEFIFLGLTSILLFVFYLSLHKQELSIKALTPPFLVTHCTEWAVVGHFHILLEDWTSNFSSLWLLDLDWMTRLEPRDSTRETWIDNLWLDVTWQKPMTWLETWLGKTYDSTWLVEKGKDLGLTWDSGPIDLRLTWDSDQKDLDNCLGVGEGTDPGQSCWSWAWTLAG